MTQHNHDPAGIHAAVERERRASRHRDRFSRTRVHPVQHDLTLLIDFVLSRRIRQPETLGAVRRAIAAVDTDAVRCLIDVALTRAATTAAIRRVCGRLSANCETLEAALTLGRELATVRKQFPRESVVEECRVAVIEALLPYGDEAATAEVLANFSELKFEEDGESRAQAVASVAQAVWQQKLDDATARLKEVESQVAALKAVNRAPLSRIVH